MALEALVERAYVQKYYVGIIPTVPTRQGYVNWIRNVMVVPVEVLPDDSIYVDLSYEMSLETVHHWINIASPKMYTQAVYNCAGAYLANIAQDDPNAQPPLQPPLDTYWTDLRTSLGFSNFMPGWVNETHDENTGAEILTPDWLQGLTLGDMQMLKTPWGRTYMAIAQSIGSMWGLTI